MRDKLGILFVVIMCWGCQTTVDQTAEKEITDEVTYKEAIAAQSRQILQQMQQLKALVKKKHEEAVADGSTEMSYEEYARDISNRMKRVIAARKQRREELMQAFPDGDADLSVLDAYANEVRMGEKVPDWYWDAYPKTTDIREAMKPIIEMRKQLKDGEISEGL